MRQCSHHAKRRPAWKLSVGVEGDHETDLWKDGEIAHLDRKAVIFAAEQLVQVQQFAALALPSHPSFFARVINAMAMEEKKRPHFLGRVLLIQLVDQR